MSGNAIPHQASPSLPLLALAVALALPGGTAFAADAPLRKPGLWEIMTRSDNIPGAGIAIQQCIDQNTDNLMQQRAKNEKADCSVMDLKRAGERVTLHAVCKVEGSTVTTDATYLGNFEAGYKGDMRSRYSPPLQGISETHMTQEARWLGACKPGQKPGDVIMPNMGSMNLNELMKDPRVQEAMRRHGAN
ncbi:DUF3617 domain-containing protein [Rhodocyclus tenuis]|uniref:DUF3617 domain-containing protein n=1 Tax=Rhodocyclus tenuis TaxID=1066 RepID=UPI001908EFB5|nr:DUF3617 family protein [Rhodocyclus tenuis]MBK1679249.1 hypothetical protein [Rhodocyclus tenuis]